MNYTKMISITEKEYPTAYVGMRTYSQFVQEIYRDVRRAGRDAHIRKHEDGRWELFVDNNFQRRTI